LELLAVEEGQRLAGAVAVLDKEAAADCDGIPALPD
jgi:hypothetical protein